MLSKGAMQTMELNFTRRRIFSAAQRTWKKWLLLAAIAMLATLIFHFLFVTEKGICSAVVNFSYAGLESGLDPNGHRFEPMEMKDAKLVRQAAEALGETVTDEDVERLQDALTVQGDIPNDAFERIVTNSSIFGEEGLEDTTHVADASYFTSRYSISLRYRDAGFSSEQGKSFLTELMNAYERRFYESYGYNESIGEVFSSLDYADYDYVDALEMMRSRLSSLRAYLTYLAEKDNARFVSSQTGYSFSELVSAVDTIQSEDVQWLDSYISYNNVTKDKDRLIDYYQYKIEDAERALEERDSRLYTLNNLIDSYEKTTAIFPNLANPTGAENESVPVYEFTQSSEMYDSLIAQKISAQTSFSETKEQLALYERRVASLRADESAGDAALVETHLSSIYGKITRLVEELQLTADEFFKTVDLKRAFQVVQEPKTGNLLSATARNSIYDIVTIEAALFGLYILYVLWSLRGKRKQEAPQERS